MPKTQFVDNGTNGGRGTRVLAAFMNLIFNTLGGHKHDDVDEDGHCAKIDLANHVTGLLSLNNNVTGNLSQLNQWASVVEFDVLWAGFSNNPSSQCIAFKSEIITIPSLTTPGSNVLRTIVRLLIPGFTGESNQASLNAPAGAIPEGYRPVNGTRAAVTVQSGTAFRIGNALIAPDGSINIFLQNADAGFDLLTFPESGSKGMYDLDLTYVVANW
jgi:hypothetical protein